MFTRTLLFSAKNPIAIELSIEGPTEDTGLPDLITRAFQTASESLGSYPSHPLGKIKIRHTNQSNQYLLNGQDLSECSTFCFDQEVVYRYLLLRRFYHVTVGNYGTGTVDLETKTVQWHMETTMHFRSAFTTLILDPISLILSSADLLLCHGAAVILQNAAVLLIAVSGSGKSSLSFLLSHTLPEHNFTWLSDDMLCLDFRSPSLQVSPIQTGFGIYPRLLQTVPLPIPDYAFHDDTGKIYFPTVPNQTTGTFPIKAMIFLQKQSNVPNTTQCQNLHSTDVLRHLLDQQPSIANPYQMQRFQMLRRLAETVPAVEVQYLEYCDVNILSDTIQAMVG